MSFDSMARLGAADPVPTPPEVESPERLRRLIEDDAPALDPGEVRHGSPAASRAARMRRRTLIAVPLCVAASVGGVVLTSGSSSGPGVNVAAAAYAATSPRPGIVEATYIVRIERGIQAGSTLLQHDWDDAGRGLRRERVRFTEAYDGKRETHNSESAFAPGRIETWARGRLEVSTPRQVAGPAEAARPADLELRMAFAQVAVDGLEGIALYRTLYREGLMKLVGHERRDGRSLWRLESGSLSSGANGRKRTMQTRLEVLVDPKTFLPVVERQIDLSIPGDPTALETTLLSYRRLPASRSTPYLFDLASQHPPRIPSSSAHQRHSSSRKGR